MLTNTAAIRACFALCGLAVLVSLSGCSLLGVAAHAVPPPTLAPVYNGLQNQSAAVMVWADPALRLDFDRIQLDVAKSVQTKLSSAKALKTTTWPWSPESIVRFQLDHPETETMPVADIAPRLGVTRLIYIEIEHFSTRGEASISLFKGSMMASVQVIEINPDKTVKVGHNENSIQVKFPPNVPAEGYPRGNDRQYYLGTIETFSTELAKRFIPHQEED